MHLQQVHLLVHPQPRHVLQALALVRVHPMILGTHIVAVRILHLLVVVVVAVEEVVVIKTFSIANLTKL